MYLLSKIARANKEDRRRTITEVPVLGKVSPNTSGAGTFGVGIVMPKTCPPPEVAGGVEPPKSEDGIKEEVPPPQLPVQPPPLGGGAVFKLKCAFTFILPFIVMVQTGLVPVQAPDQEPLKLEFESGAAVKVTTVPEA